MLSCVILSYRCFFSSLSAAFCCSRKMKKWTEKSHLLSAEKKIFQSLRGSSETTPDSAQNVPYDSMAPEEPEENTG